MSGHLSNGHRNGHDEPILDSPGETRPDNDPVVVAGRVAWKRHKETQRKLFMSDWLPIGAALVIGRASAIRDSGADTSRKDHRHGSAYYKVFGQWLTVNGFADIHDAVQKALFDIMDNLDAVLAWRGKLEDAQQREWNSPTTVWRHYQESLTPEAEEEAEEEPEPETQSAAAVDTAADTVTQDTKPAAPVKQPEPAEDTDDDQEEDDDEDIDEDERPEPDEYLTDEGEAVAWEAAQALLRSLGEDKCRELLNYGIPSENFFWAVLKYVLDHPDETAPAPEPARTPSELDRLVAELDTLKAENTRLKASKSDAALRKEIDKLRRELAEAYRDLDGVVAKETADPVRTLDAEGVLTMRRLPSIEEVARARGAEARRLQQELDNARAASGIGKDIEAAIGKLNTEVAKVTAERDKAKEQVTRLEATLADDPGESAKLMTQCNRLRTRVRNLQRRADANPAAITRSDWRKLQLAIQPDSNPSEAVRTEAAKIFGNLKLSIIEE